MRPAAAGLCPHKRGLHVEDFSGVAAIATMLGADQLWSEGLREAINQAKALFAMTEVSNPAYRQRGCCVPVSLDVASSQRLLQAALARVQMT